MLAMTVFPLLSLQGAKQTCRERSVAEAIQKCRHLKQNRSKPQYLGQANTIVLILEMAMGAMETPDVFGVRLVTSHPSLSMLAWMTIPVGPSVRFARGSRVIICSFF